MNTLITDAKNRMQSATDRLASEYAAIQAGRANASVLDKITVDYYGTATPIAQVAAISVSEARVLVIQPWDISILPMIEKAIQKSDIGINPQNDGKIIRLIFPQLTEDRRKEISKEISSMAEESKIAIRNIRRDAMDKAKNMKKSSEITEDELKQGEKKIQDLTDKFCKQIDNMCSAKTTQVMSI
jgi:ribosome recycling factor